MAGLPVDDRECRYCMFPAEPGNRLSSPCRCRGSYQYVHQRCVDQWLRQKNQAVRRCEVCLTHYVYGELWAEDRPDTLPWVSRLGVLFRSLRVVLPRPLLPNFIVLALLVLFNAVMWKDPNFEAFGVNNAWQYLILSGAVFVAWRIYDKVIITIMEMLHSWLHRITFEFLLFTIYNYLFFILMPPLIGLNSCMLVIATLFIPWIALSFLYNNSNLHALLFIPAIPFFIRTGLELLFKTFVCPLILGGLVVYCLVLGFGMSVSLTLEYIYSQLPLTLFIISMIGLLWLIIALKSNQLIQRFVRKGAFWWLITSTIHDLSVHPHQTILVYSFHASLVFITLHLPLKTISSLFPNQLRFDHQALPFGFTAGYLLLVTVEAFNWLHLIGGAIEPFVHWWINTFSVLLQLDTYLLRAQGDPDLEEINQGVHGLAFIADGSLVSLYYAGPREEDNYDARFIGKFVVMVLIAAGTLYLGSVAFGAILILGDLALFQLVSFVLEKNGLQLQNCFVVYWIVCLLLPLRRQVRSQVVKWNHHLQTIGLSLLVPYLLSIFVGQLVWPASFIVIALCFIGPPLDRFFRDITDAEYKRLYCLDENMLLDFNG